MILVKFNSLPYAILYLLRQVVQIAKEIIVPFTNKTRIKFLNKPSDNFVPHDHSINQIHRHVTPTKFSVRVLANI